MRKYFRFTLSLCAAAALSSMPSLAQKESKSSEAEGVRRAIAFQRAKDRADARQARKEARNPEKFTYAPPQNTSPDSLSNEQKKEAMEKSADRVAK